MDYQTLPGSDNNFPAHRIAPLSTFIILLSCMALMGYTCQAKKNNKSMNEQVSNPQHADTGRLLSVANVEQTDSGRKVIAWFFETPQIFEFNLDNEEAQNMFRLLKEAKEKQLPVNIYSVPFEAKNRINRITPATEAQVANYKKEKALREQPIAVPKPGNK